MKSITLHGIAAVLTTSWVSASAQQWIGDLSHTFYGWPNNDPPSNAIAYNCGRGYTAQGSGTYDYPLTFASAPGEFEKCEIIYSPYLKKYLVHEDLCVQCEADWDGGKGFWHIDVWDMAWESGGDDENACDNALTPAAKSRTIIRYPPKNLEVQAGGLYEKGGSPSCRVNRVYIDGF